MMKKLMMFSLVILIACLSSAVILAQTQEAQPAAQADSNPLEAKFKEAINLYKEKKNADAEVIFNELLKAYPTNFEVLFWAGTNYLEMKKIEEARKLAENGLIVDEKNLLMLKLKSRTYLLEKDYGEALDILDDASEYYPNDLETWLMITVTSVYHQKWGKAIDAADEALKIDPKSMFALSYKANALIAKKKWDKAIEVFDIMLSIDPQNEFAKNTKELVIKKQKEEKSSRRAQEPTPET
jgi:tetratricopeptide (TPR) repeat protein